MSEKPCKGYSGYLMLLAGILLLAAAIAVIFQGDSTGIVVVFVILLLASMLAFSGLFTVNPNDAKVMILFGKYAGTVRQNGFSGPIRFSPRKNQSARA